MTIAQQFQSIIARNDSTSRKRKVLLRALARRLDFVYFGTVDQRVDDHHVVRGFSASATHQDSSYMVGSYDGFNITMVDRFDVDFRQKLPKKHRLLICETQLKKEHDITHFFLLPKLQTSAHYNKLFMGIRSLEALTFGPEQLEFHGRYAIYGLPTHTTQLEELITPDILQTIAVHFWPAAVEVRGDRLYFYSADEHLTSQHAETLIKNSTWFAQVLDN